MLPTYGIDLAALLMFESVLAVGSWMQRGTAAIASVFERGNEEVLEV